MDRKKPNIKHLCTFGEVGYVHIPPKTQKKWTRKSCPCCLLGHTSQSRTYKLWDLNQHTVIISPGVGFDKLSTSHQTTESKETLEDLGEAFGSKEVTHMEETLTSEVEVGAKNMSKDVSRWESDNKLLQPKATEDENIPNDPNPAAPLVEEEANVPLATNADQKLNTLLMLLGHPQYVKKGI
jgi:hypothetical protein